jgi:hypothetical protein
MLEIYEECRDSMHIVDVVNALKKMEFIFTDWKHKNKEADIKLWNREKRNKQEIF